MNKFRMNQKVTILKGRKMDGRYNHGTIIGVQKVETQIFLSYRDEKEFLKRFNGFQYKVAYIDCVTNRACVEWFNPNDLVKKGQVNTNEAI